MITQNDRQWLFSQKEASKILRVSPSSLYHLRELGEIGYYKFGNRIFFSRDHLDEFINKNEVPKNVK